MIFSLLSFSRILEDNLKAKQEYENDLDKLGKEEAERLRKERCAQKRDSNRKRSLRDARALAIILSPIPIIFFFLSAMGGAPIGGLVSAVIMEMVFWLISLIAVRVKCHNPYL